MNHPPKQHSTVEDELSKILNLALSSVQVDMLYKCGGDSLHDEDEAFLEEYASQARTQIQQLITKARIDELEPLEQLSHDGKLTLDKIQNRIKALNKTGEN